MSWYGRTALVVVGGVPNPTNPAAGGLRLKGSINPARPVKAALLIIREEGSTGEEKCRTE